MGLVVRRRGGMEVGWGEIGERDDNSLVKKYEGIKYVLVSTSNDGTSFFASV